jgi:hypothetical protein
VVLPLRYGLSLEETAEALGVTPGWVSCLRNRFIQGRQVSEVSRRGGRHHALLTYEEEVELLRPFLEQIRDDFAPGAPIGLMFQDEARFGRITDVRRAWAPLPSVRCVRPW